MSGVPDTNPMPVETSDVLFGEVVDAVDPSRQRENALRPVVYVWGGKVSKRDGEGPYGA